jgi:hypothetical protein
MPGFQPLSFKEASCSLKGNAGEGVAQVVQCLPNKHEALSSNSMPPKKKQKQQVFKIVLPSRYFLDIQK